MRRAIWSLLTTDTDLTALLPPERLFRVGRYGVDYTELPVDPADGPFGFISYSIHSPIKGKLTSRNLTLNVHGARGSYTPIDAVLIAARAAFRAASYPLAADDGTYLNSAVWNGDGPDDFDTGWGTLVKSSTWTVVGSGEE